MKTILLAGLAAIGAFAAPSVGAQAIGDSITVSYAFPTQDTTYGGFTATPATFTVGAGQESVLTVDGFPIGVDFTGTSLALALPSVGWSSSSYNGPTFLNNTSIFSAITSVTGIDASRVAVSGNLLTVNWNGLSFAQGDSINIAFASAGVPEPATWALMILGMGAVGGAMRRRSAVKASVRFA